MAIVFDPPDDVLEDILLRLPFKQTRRCLLVCRGWRNLGSKLSFASHPTSFQSSNKIHPPFTCHYQIMQPSFKGEVPIDHHHLYSDMHKKKHFLSTKKHFLSLDFLPISMSGNIHVLGKQWVSLPHTPSPQRGVVTGFYCEIYYDKYEDKNTSIWTINNTQFIVLRYLVCTLMELEIFASETGVWRKIVLHITNQYFSPRSWVENSIIYNGMFWYQCDHKYIYKFNLDHNDDNQQRWDIVNLPSDIYAPCGSFVGVTNGRMRLSQLFTYKDKIMHKWRFPALRDLEPSLRIWELDDLEEWTLVHEVYLKDLDEKFNNHLKSMEGYPLKRQIYFHPVESDNIIIRLGSSYFEYNTCHEAMKFQSLEDSETIQRRFPLMLTECPTPIPKLI
ncbi:hypothetical protein ACFE04_026443 [Oxalis oulophora]